MDAWSVLGIAPTTNARAIKRAYAKQVASHHPEDDPVGFQRVQAAYEQALACARSDRSSHAGDVGANRDGRAEADGDATAMQERAGQRADEVGVAAAPRSERADEPGAALESGPLEGPAHDDALDRMRAANAMLDIVDAEHSWRALDLTGDASHRDGAPMPDAGLGAPRRAETPAAEPRDGRFAGAEGRREDEGRAGAACRPDGWTDIEGGSSADDASIWRERFLRLSADDDVFADGASLRSRTAATPDYIDSTFEQRSRLRDEAAEFIESSARVVSQADHRAVRSLFEQGSWKRYLAVQGFDETVANMIEDYVGTLAEADLNKLEDVVAKQLTSAEEAPHIARVFDDARGTIVHRRKKKRASIRATVIFMLLIVFQIVRMEARTEHNERHLEDTPAISQDGSATEEFDAMEEHMARVEREKELLGERKEGNEAFVLAEMEGRYGEPFAFEEPGIWPFAVGSNTAACTVVGQETGTMYDLDLAYDDDRVVTQVTDVRPREE